MLYLTEPTLGRLDLDCVSGYTPIEFSISWPEVRRVTQPLALRDGVNNRTRYLGQRVVTVALRLDQTVLPTQALLDAVLPFLSPRYRPTFVYSVEKDTPQYLRSLTVVGADAPVVIAGPRFQTIVLQWVTTDAFARSLDEQCVISSLTGGVEEGRDYDLTFDRSYPPSEPFGVTELMMVGNAPTDWTATITAEVVDPVVAVNGVDVAFDVTLLPGQTINIDTAQRTILRNNDPSDSIYALTNFEAWRWDDLRLRPGMNTVRLEAASSPGGDPFLTLCWRAAWH